MSVDSSSSELTSTMEHVLVANKNRQEEENQTMMHHRRCTPQARHMSSYQLRLKNKGAILVLVWNFLLVSLFFYLTVYMNHARIYFAIWGLTIPVAGWLADVYFGRYKLIHWSMWIMWIASMLATVSSLVAQNVDGYSNVNEKVIVVLLSFMAFGFGVYHGNIIQFGLDQLHDASTNEIKSFICWFVWTYMSAGIFLEYVSMCKKDEYKIFGQLLVCICVTTVLTLTQNLSGILVKDPLFTQNPFKQVYSVIYYVFKHRHLNSGSTFTYYEDDKIPSRLDLAKSKYGGPFTAEQVEDVKTFLRLLTIAAFGCTVASGLLLIDNVRDQIYKLLTPATFYDLPKSECYLYATYTKIIFYSAGVVIPLNELIFRPLLRKYFSWVTSYWKFTLSVLLQIARVLSLTVILIIIRYEFIQQAQHHTGYSNATLQCIFVEDAGALVSTIDYKWVMLPSFLNSMSIAAFGIGGIEFLCAQAPYSMRGLIAGAAYASVAIFRLIGSAVTYPFSLPLSVWGSGIIGCGFWYLLLCLLFLVFNCIMLCVFRRLYKNRKREDILLNEQMFAERYYNT